MHAYSLYYDKHLHLQTTITNNDNNTDQGVWMQVYTAADVDVTHSILLAAPPPPANIYSNCLSVQSDRVSATTVDRRVLVVLCSSFLG